MPDLRPLTALGGTEPRVDKIGQITVTEVTDIAIASVAARLGQEKNCVTALTKILGAAPPPAGRAVFSDDISGLWLGPDQWLLTASHAGHEDLAATMKNAIKGASITEQNDAWVCFDVAGPEVTKLFERLCAVPLRRLETGAAQRTTIEHLGCIVIVTGTGSRVRILGPRSSAASLHHALTTAARSISQ